MQCDVKWRWKLHSRDWKSYALVYKGGNQKVINEVVVSGELGTSNKCDRLQYMIKIRQQRPTLTHQAVVWQISGQRWRNYETRLLADQCVADLEIQAPAE